MADFDLTQTGAQVQSILNDAQDAQGAGAQTTLTTDYIMLKGTNGRYHKILKNSFTEAVRNVLAGLLVNNDKGTTISQIAAIASGDFGSITPANLALVLGGQYQTTAPVATGTSVDIALEYGCSYVFSDSQGHSLAFISVLYSGVVISANSGTWTAENDTPSGNYIIKVTKGVTNDGTVRITNNGANTRVYYYRRLI